MSRCFEGRRNAGFLLLETMIGVTVFAIGILAMARSVERCLDAEEAQLWDERARLALENRMAEIEAGAVVFEIGNEEKLEGMFRGITLNQTRTPSRLVDADNKELAGLYQVRLEAVWKEAGTRQFKALTFYVQQTQR
ncbi:MAG: hypothetical protein PHQ12_11470 [Chthoniobacteraceae bacterium]|nr:hypothetical protein [Chthoniobacteraceae bacterium]